MKRVLSPRGSFFLNIAGKPKDPWGPFEVAEIARRTFALQNTIYWVKSVAVEIDSSKGNPHGIPRAAHSVLTEHFVDEPGHPTRDALDQVLAFFTKQLTEPQ